MMKRHRHIRKKLVGALAAVVVFCTTYALILPAVTLSSETHCGKEEHTHIEECYRSGEYLCGQEESDSTEGHVHDESCYQEMQTLICGQEESELHVHDETCYLTEQVLICDKNESEGTEGHIHTDDCKKSSEPMCGKEEHTHSRQCESDPEAVETEEDWKKTVPADLKEDVRERVLQVAESQKGYKESDKNFRVNDDGTEDGFTRYGEWAGDRYGDWNNAFTGWVLKYANAKAGWKSNADEWIAARSEDLVKDAKEAKAGDVVFYQDDEGKRKSGILESYDEASKKAKIYAGDVEKSVKVIDRSAAQLIGSLQISEKAPSENGADTETPGDGSGEDNPEDSESDQQTKTVSIEGADNKVQTGDEITLTAVPQGFEDGEILHYQWQYNDTENADSEAWKDLEGETSDKLTILVTDDNLTHHWRVGITQEVSTDSYTGGGNTEGAAYKLKPLVPVQKLEEVMTGSEETASDGTETIYSGDVVLKTANEETDGINAAAETDVTPNSFIIEKKWTKQPLESEVTSVPVQIRYGDYNPETYQPDLLEGMVDPNPVIMETEISYDSGSRTWKREISYSELLTKFKEKYPDETANYTKFYVTETLDGYLASYQRQEVADDNFRRGALSLTEETKNRSSFIVNDDGLRSENYYIDYGSDYWWKISSFRADSSQHRAHIYEVVAQEKLDIQYTITNTKVASGSFGSGTIPMAEKEIPHSKTIDYLGDSVVNPDAGYGSDKNLSDSYRLYLDAGPIADENPVNLILVLDTSASMNENLGNTSTSRWSNLKNTLVGNTGVLQDFYKLNPMNQVRLITFASLATIDNTVYKDFSSVKNKLNGTSLQSGDLGGTNYEDALLKLSGVIDQTPRGYSTYVIFLSDGVPTVHNADNSYEIGGSNKTNMVDAERTVEQIKALYADSSRQFTLSTIAYDTSPSVFLAKNTNGQGTFTYHGESLVVPDLPSKDGFCGSASDVVSLQEQLYLMCIGPRCDNLVIQDTLSENVDFDLNNTSIIVKAIPTGVAAEPVTIYKTSSLEGIEVNPNQALTNEASNFSFENRDTIGTNVNVKNWTNAQVFGSTGGVFVDLKSKTIQLKFNPDWSMDPAYRYELSFNVETTAEAYEKFDNQQMTYNKSGDSNSDYRPSGNTTSSNRGGFFSNESSALNYRYKNPYKESETQLLATNPGNGVIAITPYQKPVVQTDAALLDVFKVSSDGSQKLNGAVFEIYDDLSKDPLREYTTSGTGENAGHIDIGRVQNGKVYYLKEKTPPAGYLQDNVIFRITFNGKKTTVEILDGNGNPGQFETGKYISIGINGRRVTLTIKNEQGKPLPETGGSGTQLLTSAGAAMIAGSLLMYGYKKRLRGKERRFK
ncbi:DUF7604 domain-containing protein [Faecalibaculum rodentium]|uniref:DUF7604 domain-containing protein n=1 Tax=Faecalibaculum rodentium TaxID=1702221 RepID=UPI00259BB317|nr:VWA domain-containing protein [Faecalibaculum rodentium]